MSMTPSALLQKLDELKKWQQNQQARLLHQHNSQLHETEKTTSSDYDTIKGLSAFESIYNNETEVEEHKNLPKQPFLKRGAGLAKFGMKPGDQKRTIKKLKLPKTSVHKRLHIQREAEKKYWEEQQNLESYKQSGKIDIISPIKKDEKCANVENTDSELKVPDINISHKTKWYNPNETDANSKSSDNSLIQQINKFVSNPTDFREDDLLSLQHLIADKLSNVSQLNSFSNEDLLKIIKDELTSNLQELAAKSNDDNQFSDITSQEQALAKELHVFEKLEQRVLNSSFCSTSSSVLQLLASTPSKHFTPIRNVPQKNVHFQEHRKSLPKFLDFQQSPLSSNNSVTSEDLQDTTLQSHQEWDNDETQTATSAPSSSSSSVCSAAPQIIVRQNACVMTDNSISDTNFKNDSSIQNKLEELDKEIVNFRIENKKLQKKEYDFEQEKYNWGKEKKRLQQQLLEERVQMEHEFEEKKKKFTKEKQTFERYMKDLENKPSRKERDEISRLKSELANVTETLKLKETRNGTAQARLRNQVKSLEKENANLKEEVEKLQKQNARLVASSKTTRKSSESVMLKEINKNLNKLAQETKAAKVKTIDRNNSCDDKLLREKETTKSRDSFESEYRKRFNKQSRRCRSPVSSEDDEQENRVALSPGNRTPTNYHEKNGSRRTSQTSPSCKSILVKDTSSTALREKENDQNSSNEDSTSFRSLSEMTVSQNYQKVFGNLKRNSSLNDTQASSGGKVVTLMEDGSKRTTYPNGNVKVQTGDGKLLILKYFNNDIKETNLLDGTIRYYYAESHIWQTVLINGDEILEFPDGQIEKNFVNKTSEILYPDGTVKYRTADNSEKITYTDGTVCTISENGERVLLLPNGQKEYHTKEHKRREFPDGTIKIVYPDGLTETRYSNGRIRMRDKDGKLLMDSHQIET